jgi:ABC-type lipoprotein export system ATPase subunit
MAVVQILSGDGTFKREAAEAFAASAVVGEQRTNYQVVAIMGPQSSGKSTLMNHLVSRRWKDEGIR